MGRARAAKANGSSERHAEKSKKMQRQKSKAKVASEPAAGAGQEQAVAEFLDGLAAALMARSKAAKKWKLEAVAAALERAVASLPDSPAKKHFQGSLGVFAVQLHQQLTAGAATGPPGAAAGGGGSEAAAEEEEPGPPKPAKRAKTGQQHALGVDDPWGLLFDGIYKEACQQCLAGELPAGLSPLALAAARCPPPAELLAAALTLPPAPAGPGAPAPEALSQAAEAVGLCSALATLAGTTAEGLACFGPLAEWLLKAAGAMQEPALFRQEPSAAQRWRQLDAAASRLLSSMQLLLRQHAQQQQGGGGGVEGSACLRALPVLVAGPQGADADGVARLTAAHAVMLRAMCRDAGAQLLVGRPAAGGRPGPARKSRAAAAAGAGGGFDSGLATQAAADLRRLAPFGSPGLVELMASTPPGSVEASSEGVRSFLCLQQALTQWPAAGPAEFLLRLAVARRAADACRAVGGTLASHGQVTLAAAARTPAPMELVEGLRRQPPSAVVAAALAAAGAGGQQGLTAYLLREPSIKVLLALALKLGGAEGDGGGAARRGQQSGGSGEAVEAEGAAGEGADELLFFVSTDADETMFGRDWGTDEESDEAEENEGEGEGAGRKGVRLGELSDAENEDQGDESSSQSEEEDE